MCISLLHAGGPAPAARVATDSVSAALRQVVRRYSDGPWDAVKQAGSEFKRLGFQITDGASSQ